MKRSRSRSQPVLLTTLLLAVLLAACVGGDESSSSSGGTEASTVTTRATRLSGTLNASGATFPQAFYEEVIAGYKEAEPEVTINYSGGGSGKGRQEMQDMVVDFAGSDGLVKPEDVAKFKGGEFLYVPTITAPITVSYNLGDVEDLKLDAPTTAKIFQREIKQWDDAAVKALNPGLKLPATPITVVRRADGSGTTENFTRYLAAAAPGVWKLAPGSTVEWPADTQGGNGNTGVAQAVKSAAGAIGYVDLSDAQAGGLKFAALKNKAGKFVKATVGGATAALEGVTPNADLSYNPLDAAGEKAYPITAPTWILVYKNQTDRAKADTIRSFLTYLLEDGQKVAPEIGYAPLPASFRDKALAQLDNIVLP